jgi:predicted small lipoprotein YifL
MRTTLVALAAAAVLATVAGCGQPVKVEAGPPTTEPASDIATPVGPTSGATGTTTVPVEPSSLPADATAIPATQVDATAMPKELKYGNEAWQFDGGRSLRLTAITLTGCGDVSAKVVDQKPDAVRITVTSMDTPQGGKPDDQICTQSLTPKPVTVHLDDPLGDRTIYLAGGR